MKNLEQIRAAAAIGPAGSLDKKAINKLPAMILSNGLLATTAFCYSDGGGESRSEMKQAMEATARHLADQKLVADSEGNLEKFARNLSGESSQKLQRATAEALAYIGYLRRFARKKENGRTKV